MTQNDLNGSYAVIRHNVRTYRSGGVVEVLKGKLNAESAVKELQACQSSPDRHEGWRYFVEKTDMQAGTDPAAATDLRQSDLEIRESKAIQETDPFQPPSSNPSR